VIAFRDPAGVRPLCLGRLEDRFVVASESCALDIIGAELMREVQPGELVSLGARGLESRQAVESDRPAVCVFEHIYFSRPDSKLEGRTLQSARGRMGELLAREAPVEADIVIPVPDSGVPAALGYAQQSGIPFDVGLIRSHYVGRTFIEPQQSIRHFGVKLKLSAVRSVLNGKRVVVVDDSVVRGTTSRKIVKMLRAAGATEVHLRISSPPTRWPCYYGIDTPSRQELIASSHSVEEIARYVTADSVGYLSIAGLSAAVGDPEGKTFCNACFSGQYPTKLEAGAQPGTQPVESTSAALRSIARGRDEVAALPFLRADR
jgi:amidophosphoribosyltransferase